MAELSINLASLARARPMMSTRYIAHLLRQDSFLQRFLSRTLVTYLTILTLFIGIVFAPLMQQLDDLNLTLHERARLAQEFLALHHRLWWAVAIVALLLSGHALLLGHKIAGPLTRMRQLFDAMATGELPAPMTIRQRDYLHREVQSLNGMLDALRTDRDVLSIQATGVRGALAELRHALTRGSLIEAQEQLQDLENRFETAACILSRCRSGTARMKEQSKTDSPRGNKNGPLLP